jgi:hypothetical protein
MPAFQEGTTDQRVLDIQRRLNGMGYKVPTDGKFSKDSPTVRAIGEANQKTQTDRSALVGQHTGELEAWKGEQGERRAQHLSKVAQEGETSEAAKYAIPATMAALLGGAQYLWSRIGRGAATRAGQQAVDRAQGVITQMPTRVTPPNASTVGIRAPRVDAWRAEGFAGLTPADRQPRFPARDGNPPIGVNPNAPAVERLFQPPPAGWSESWAIPATAAGEAGITGYWAHQYNDDAREAEDRYARTQDPIDKETAIRARNQADLYSNLMRGGLLSSLASKTVGGVMSGARYTSSYPRPAPEDISQVRSEENAIARYLTQRIRQNEARAP